MPEHVQHVVLFRFPRDLADDAEGELFAQVRAWPERIGGFARLRIGRDLTGARSRGYQYLLFAEFEDHDRLEAYVPHPVHRAFSDWIVEHGGETLAFDYALTNEAVAFGD